MSLKVYKSSAGSGKTFTLVKEYIKLLILNPNDYRHILAITFTNKATEEMKSRILKGLQALSKGEEETLLSVLLDELPEAYNAEKIARNAHDAYLSIIHDYSRFEVSTIDSFFSKVLKSFAKELDLPLSYEVEMNTELALAETIENLYRQLEDHKEIRQWLKNYAQDRIDSDDGWNVESNIQKLGKNLFNESFQEGFKGNQIELSVLSQVISDLKKQVKVFESTCKAFAEKAFYILEINALTIEDFNFKKSGAMAAFYALEKNEFEPELKKRFMACMNGEANWGAKKSDRFELVNQVGESQIQPLGIELLDFILKERPNYNTEKAILKNIYAYGLLEVLDQKLKEYRDEHNVMLISDTNSILKEIIQGGDAPFIFEKIGSYFKHIMIDEFQDTSNYQWSNIKPLIINALSEGQEVLVVGDVKQSIYRFRGGNMRLLLSEIKKDLGTFYEKTTDQNLSANYRSAKEIVSFNNQLFERLPKAFQTNESLLKAELLTQAFEGHAQEIKHENGGYVSFKFFEEDWKEEAVAQLLVEITNNLEKGYQYADILILVNRNAEIPEVAAALLQEHIPFINGESLRLEQSDLVQFILEVLKRLSAGSDYVQRLNLITLYQRIKNQELQSVFEFKERKQVDVTDFGIPEEFFQREPSLKQLSVFELVSELLVIFDFKAEADIYLQQLLDLVLSQSQKGVHSIAAFLEWWEKEGVNQMVSTSEQTNAVRILSIHKAKGLEAPIVFIPFTSWDVLPSGTRHQFWTQDVPEAYSALKFIPLNFTKAQLTDSHFKEVYYREAEESALDILNKTYVAFTRPREKLYLSAPVANAGAGKVHQLILPALEELGMDLSEETYGLNYTLGLDHESLNQREKGKDSSLIEVYPDSSYLDQLTIRNDSDRFFMLQETEQAQNISLGNQVHDVLADIRQVNDLEMVLRQRLQSGEMDKKTIDQVRLKIEKLFVDERIAGWFTDEYEVLNERSIWYEGKELKPDRLMIEGEKAIVIDYKKEVESDAHVNQVRRYMRAVQSMGYPNVEGYLIYVEPSQVKEVTL